MPEATSSSRGLKVEAPAKVNLSLRVLGTRDDGYHDLESVVAAVGLSDTLVLEPAEGLHLEARGLDVPPGEDNLIMKAARALAEACGVRQGARIRLEKRIPPGRGLGGGSSDAAAALDGLNTLWQCGLDRQGLARIGASVGSDVPLFFGASPVVMRGRGERVEPAAARSVWWLALAWPDFGLATVEVYAAYDRLPPAADGRPAATEILRYLGGPSREARPYLVNDLERAAAVVRNGRLDLRGVLEQAGAPAVGMTGSGSAYFAAADTEGEARRLAEAARAAGAEAQVVRLLVGGGKP
ncbi:MAG: 4-(cytidine 5'-diphospho)-2-C-methyl-D-erythritol kinase [Planctomycetes bacterium]|nr:4-(cytidine 5'-diphospho)-2-C-methyl-D-erythritol kinase [Planctomycetota bacterium]